MKFASENFPVLASKEEAALNFRYACLKTNEK